jgi:hypothetical protein
MGATKKDVTGAREKMGKGGREISPWLQPASERAAARREAGVCGGGGGGEGWGRKWRRQERERLCRWHGN